MFMRGVLPVPPSAIVEESRLSRLSPLTVRYILEYKRARLEKLRERRKRLLIEAEEEFDLVPLLRLGERAGRMEGNILRLRAELRDLLVEERRRLA